MSDWLRTVYDRADALDAEGYARFFEEDGTFTLANNPPMRGRAEIKAGLTQFFGTIAGMRHEFLRTYQLDGTEIMEAAVTYTRKDGTQVTPATHAAVPAHTAPPSLNNGWCRTSTRTSACLMTCPFASSVPQRRIFTGPPSAAAGAPGRAARRP